MAHEFRFLADTDEHGVWRLPAEECQHALKVLRIKDGARVEITDGRGRWATATLHHDGRSAWCDDVDCHTVAPSSCPLHLAIGALDHGELDEILPALVELGVDAIHVFHQEGSERSRLAEKAISRWRRIILAAVKQSKRAWIPCLRTHGSLDTLLDDPDARSLTTIVLWDETGVNARHISYPGQGLLIVTGSERGFVATDTRALDDRGATRASLGPHVLRAKTAAIAATAVFALARQG